MIRIAICEDETPTRAYLVSLIQAQNRPCEITAYASAGDYIADRPGNRPGSFWTSSWTQTDQME